jgi:hypothetical protein
MSPLRYSRPAGQDTIRSFDGDGTLRYDDFGNLRIEIRADQQAADLLRAAGVETRDGTISSDGRVVVDMQNRSTKDEAGKTLSTGRWKKMPPQS